MDFEVGQSATTTRMVTEEDVNEFARISGDTNPVHMEESFASKTRFGRRIAHGAFVTSLISKVAGNQLPGPGSIVLSSSFSFHSPCYIGDTITAKITIKRYRKDKPLIFTSCEVVNQDGECLVTGDVAIYFEKVDS